MSQSARFWDRVAERYAKSPIADAAAYRKKLQVTQDYLRPDMEVLEFGCGTGSTALIHAPHVKHIRAIDISPKTSRSKFRPSMPSTCPTRRSTPCWDSAFSACWRTRRR